MSGLPAVLAYHKIGTPEFGGTWCTRGQLRAHLGALRGAGFGVVGAATFERRLDGAGGDAPEVLVTFDDAFASFEEQAWPELQAQGVPPVLFVVSGYVGRLAAWDWPLPGRRVPHLDWPALRALAHAGVTIGAHSATHRDLRRLDDRALDAELRGARLRLEDGIGAAVRAVAYPFGRSDARVRVAAAASGYALGFSMCPPPDAGLDRYELRRHGVYIIDGARAVLDKVDVRRPGHVVQDRVERGINACAGLVAGLAARAERDAPHKAG